MRYGRYHGMVIRMIPQEQIEKYTTMMYRLLDRETWDDKVVGLNTRTSSSIRIWSLKGLVGFCLGVGI